MVYFAYLCNRNKGDKLLSRIKKNKVMKTGLSIYPATENDRVAIENLIDYEGYTAEWNEEWECYFFEEETDLYDALEREIREGLGHEINCTFEGEF